MIKSIEIKNFKSIKKKYFPLRNLNLLFGLNGMGKSSFIQSLLVLKQSNSISQGRLDINNSSYVNLGNTKDVLYQYCKKGEDLAFLLTFQDDNTLDLKFSYSHEADFFIMRNITSSIIGDPKLFKEISDEPIFTDNFQYLNAYRIEPKSVNLKNYTSVIHFKNVGNFGQFTAHFIEAYHNEEVEFENLIHKDSYLKDDITGEIIVNKTLINQINLWMGEISPNVNIRTTSISSEFVLLEYAFKQPNFGNTNRFKPENVGFGISYVLPVVVALLASRPGELIIIENPESHIHPKGQAILGKLIAKVAQNDVQIIVETHSDHILNGIRVAVKEEEISKDKVIAFYFEKEIGPSEQYSKITNIEIDKNGELSDYPPDFLDEWSNQLLKLL